MSRLCRRLTNTVLLTKVFGCALILIRCFAKPLVFLRFCRFRDVVIVANSEQVMLLYFRPRVLRIRASPVVGISFAIDRCHVVVREECFRALS